MPELNVVPYERDIDLLLLEEIHANRAFRGWLVAEVMGHSFDAGEFVDALHSVDSQFGESDLEVRFSGASGNGWRLLIENKIDAPLQPMQAERYQVRGDAYRSVGDCADYATLLMAPNDYLKRSATQFGFAAAVSYERVAEWIEAALSEGPRGAYRARVLRRAIARAAGLGDVAYDSLATRFWQDYRDLVDAEFRQLSMAGKRETLRRGGGTWAEFTPIGLPEGAWRIVHDVGAGVAYLMFPRMGKQLYELEAMLGTPPAEIGAQYERRGDSGTVTIRTAKMRTREPFATQADVAREDLRRINSLYEWSRRR